MAPTDPLVWNLARLRAGRSDDARARAQAGMEALAGSAGLDSKGIVGPLADCPDPVRAVWLLEKGRNGGGVDAADLEACLPAGDLPLRRRMEISLLAAAAKAGGGGGRIARRLCRTLLERQAIGTDSIEGTEAMFDEEKRGCLHQIHLALPPAKRPSDARRAAQAALEALDDLALEADGRGVFDAPGLSLPARAFLARWDLGGTERVGRDLAEAVLPAVDRASSIGHLLNLDARGKDGAALISCARRLAETGVLDGWPGLCLTFSCGDDSVFERIEEAEALGRGIGTPLSIRLVGPAGRFDPAGGLDADRLRFLQAALDLTSKEGVYSALFARDLPTAAFCAELARDRADVEVQRPFGFRSTSPRDSSMTRSDGVRRRVHAPVGEGDALTRCLLETLS